MNTEHNYHIVFKSSTHNAMGAAMGTLTLYDGHRVILASEAFSGGLSSPARSWPIPAETYRIHLEIRNTVSTEDQLEPIPGDRGLMKLHNFYGIEKIDYAAAQIEWGHFRAALNEPKPRMASRYRGNFLHGKLRQGDYTHGCICERSERILNWLWLLKPTVIPVKVHR